MLRTLLSRTIEQRRHLMLARAHQTGDLHHPDVLKASQTVDRLIVLYQNLNSQIDSPHAEDVIELIVGIVRELDPELARHHDHVGTLASLMADRLGLGRDGVRQANFAGRLLDLGKLLLSRKMLTKPGSLLPHEWKLIKLHPSLSTRLIEGIPSLKFVLPPILYHHEYMNGDGYPVGLRGHAIPLGARILAVADTFNALTHPRPYRKKVYNVEESLMKILSLRGIRFDPQMIWALEQVLRSDDKNGLDLRISCENGIK